MKFLSPSSSSASSPSDTAFSTPRNAAFSCLPAALRRLLCFYSLPTHPFDHIKEDPDQELQPDPICNFETLVHPGIVARLMGLDPMPVTGTARSRSLNSAATREGFGLMQSRRTGINSTQYMLEVPSYLELETDEFFILSFEGEGKDREPRKGECFKERRRSADKNREIGEGRNRGNQELAAGKVNSHGRSKDSKNLLRPTNKNFELNAVGGEDCRRLCETETGRKWRCRKKSKENWNPLENVGTECDSENSSPVSVLDPFVEFSTDQQLPNSAKDSRLKNSNSRRKLSGTLKSNTRLSPPGNANISNKTGSQGNKTEERYTRSRMKKDFEEIWIESRKLADTEMMSSNRMDGVISQVEEFEEIGVKLEIEILDQLISEMMRDVFTAY